MYGDSLLQTLWLMNFQKFYHRNSRFIDHGLHMVWSQHCLGGPCSDNETKQLTMYFRSRLEEQGRSMLSWMQKLDNWIAAVVLPQKSLPVHHQHCNWYTTCINCLVIDFPGIDDMISIYEIGKKTNLKTNSSRKHNYDFKTITLSIKKNNNSKFGQICSSTAWSKLSTGPVPGGAFPQTNPALAAQPRTRV